jgi:chemotaxis protein methyltransferase CheR
MPMTKADFEFIRQLIQKESGMILDREKRYLAETRLGRLAEMEGYGSTSMMVRELQNGERSGVLTRKAVEAMTIAETLFFRDMHPFDALRKVVFPDLVAKRATERRLTIWSAACATGQEPYSIGMILQEEFSALKDWAVSIIASDISMASLERAKEGRFRQIEVNRGLPAALLIKYFTQTGSDWQAKKELQRMIDFRRINLTEPWPYLPLCDVVLLRNVLIYFDVETKKAILGRIRRQLRPPGYLFLGASETTLNLDAGFERVNFEHGACFRLVKT